MEAKNVQQMTAINVLGLLLTLNPVLLHLSGLVFVGLFTWIFKTNKKWVRVTICTVFLWAMSFLIIVKTKTDINLFRLMRVSRFSIDKDMHHGLDRLESVIDIEIVQEMESKLTGRSANYYLKGSR
jgi:hypothetical protein